MRKKRYYSRLFRIFLSYKRKKVRLDYLPVRLWIEPTSLCNLRCIMCPNKYLEKSQKGFMEFDLFKKIIDEARSFVFDVHLLHRGESLLHPDFFKMSGTPMKPGSSLGSIPTARCSTRRNPIN